MKTLKNSAMAAMFIMVAATVMSVYAQGPMQKQVIFTINAPFEMHKSGVVLPAGKYVLYQVSQQDLNLFALYKEDLTHSPLALVRTARIDYRTNEYPDDTRMLINTDEEANENVPVINGWTIPGMDGWEIIATVPDRDRIARYSIASVPRKVKNVEIVVTTVNF
jgi:hypothetical protein